MAIITNIEYNHRTYNNAYIRASVASSDKQLTCIVCEVWESIESRNNYPTPLFMLSYSLNTINSTSDNPMAYAYTLLELNNIFNNATYNVN